jgi:predicted ATPase
MIDLPRPLTSFIGREDEVADLTRRLSSTRLLTLTGPGGAGKTRLAIEAARRFDGGRVWFVDLSPIVDAALIPAAIATAAGIAEVAGETPLETLASTLSDARVLLLLDNCEHLVVPCAVAVAHLLQACHR